LSHLQRKAASVGGLFYAALVSQAARGPVVRSNLAGAIVLVQRAASNKYGPKWRSYEACKSILERISDKKFQRDTHDFRHAYNHRFSPRVVVGMTRFVTRRVDPKSKGVTYAFGGIPPFKLDVVADLLTEQCERCYAARGAFQQLVREHEASISACRHRQ